MTDLNGLDFDAQRIVLARPGGPTLVTFGTEQSVPGMSLQVLFTDNIQTGGLGDYDARVPAPDQDGHPEVWSGTEDPITVYDIKQN